MADDKTENGEVQGTDSPIPAERFTEDPGEGGEEELPRLLITGQYIKDLSFEAPNTPNVFPLLQNEMPNIPISIDLNASQQGNNFEVVLKIRAEATVQDTLAYIAEVAYAGLFQVNVPEDFLSAVLLIDCPLILFPYLRKIISDVTADGGFAPLMLAPVDFAALYQQKMQEEQVATDQPAAT